MQIPTYKNTLRYREILQGETGSLIIIWLDTRKQRNSNVLWGAEINTSTGNRTKKLNNRVYTTDWPGIC
jgi:hypothetical protein